ncbi:RloB domain-containing protein [Mucilaginibacter paludis]|uniref:RloB-like protein n=1 Tax=Mucilaginibacter paludis DSM 18603 TaxID=714943 RepID=H1YCB1_9SPHI|nr:RloB domain-containing protein [Mucilaginibacter paludis]EHQ30102.1 hypothetical protein Mucpa_6044 [Mucilaginibacter paludis DSM 18603]
MTLVIENAENYDKSIWVLDLDAVIKENREKAQSKQDPMADLKKILDKVAGNNKIDVLINTPCFEFWFLLHVKETGKYYAECDPISKELKKFHPVEDYEKTKKYFTNSANDIYRRLKPYQTTGYRNSRKLGDFNISNPQQAKAEMFKIFDLLDLNK